MNYIQSLKEHNLIINRSEEEIHKIISVIAPVLNLLNISEHASSSVIVIFTINYYDAHIKELSELPLVTQRLTILDEVKNTKSYKN